LRRSTSLRAAPRDPRTRAAAASGHRAHSRRGHLGWRALVCDGAVRGSHVAARVARSRRSCVRPPRRPRPEPAPKRERSHLDLVDGFPVGLAELRTRHRAAHDACSAIAVTGGYLGAALSSGPAARRDHQRPPFGVTADAATLRAIGLSARRGSRSSRPSSSTTSWSGPMAFQCSSTSGWRRSSPVRSAARR
jgi:hypothetical protein